MTDDLGVRGRWWVLTAVVAGVLLGAVDLLLQRSLPYPWANLANSSAVWAVGAFAIGWWLRRGVWRSAVAGVVLLVVAVEAYYVAAAVVLHDDVAVLWSAVAAVWMGFGVLAGVVFGVAGGLSRDGRGWVRVVATALPGAVLLAEAAVLARRPGGDGGDGRWTAVIEAVLGVALILALSRGAGTRLRVLAAGIGLAVLGFGAFLAAGFGG